MTYSGGRQSDFRRCTESPILTVDLDGHIDAARNALILMPWILALVVVERLVDYAGSHVGFLVERRRIVLGELLHASKTENLRMDFIEIAIVIAMRTRGNHRLGDEAEVKLGISADSDFWRLVVWKAFVPLKARAFINAAPGGRYRVDEFLVI